MRLLLDEGFPSPPEFRPETVDATVEVVPLRQFDASLAGSSTPDWYIYLRAQEAGFDALVTRDWHQSEQIEELWTLSRTDLSVVTWRRPIEDPVRRVGPAPGLSARGPPHDHRERSVNRLPPVATT